MQVRHHFANFSFPLNVYAYVLDMEPEKLRYLHYGWFDDPSEPIAVAQERSTQELFAWLLPAPARVLEVGAGIGTTLAMLRARGYDVLGITPDESQIACIRKRYGDDFPVYPVRFEDLDVAPWTFDCILFRESSQYISLELLFSRAASLLCPGGQLIIIDEVILGEPESGDHLHPLEHLKSEATEQGFSLVEERDLSRRAVPTIDFRLEATAKHRDALRRLLAISDEQISSLDESNQKYCRKYASGSYGYAVLCFHAAASPSRWIAADMPASHSSEMLSLFREVFGHELNESMRRWKYVPERSRAFGVWNREGKLVAHYGGFVRMLSMFGETTPALQIGDVMVHPLERAVMTRRGAFFWAASGFFDRYVGREKPYSLAFGFPNSRAIKIGQRLGLYASVEKIFRRSWSSEGGSLPFWLVFEPLFHRPDWAQETDRLWQKMNNDMGEFVLVCRDAAYLRYRYQERPDGGYGVYLVRNWLTGYPKAIVVVKQKGDRLDWLDFVGSRATIFLAINAVLQLARASGTPDVSAWLTGCMLKYFSGGGGKTEATDVEIAQSDWNLSKGMADSTCGHWWLMYGDTDFL